MARGKAKKPGEPKCRGCGGLVEGRPMVIISGSKWHADCAEKKGKKIPAEYKSAKKE